MADPTDNRSIEVMKFTMQILARQEALETLLVQGKPITKQSLHAAFLEAEKSLAVGRAAHLDGRTSELDLAEIRKTMRSRQKV